MQPEDPSCEIFGPAFVGLYGLLLIFVKLSLTFGMPQSQTLACSRAAAASVFQYAGYISKKPLVSFQNQAVLWFTRIFLGEGKGSIPSNPPFFFAEKGPKLFTYLTF